MPDAFLEGGVALRLIDDLPSASLQRPGSRSAAAAGDGRLEAGSGRQSSTGRARLPQFRSARLGTNREPHPPRSPSPCRPLPAQAGSCEDPNYGGILWCCAVGLCESQRENAMSGTFWTVILEVSTLLGGLAALVFFFDRFRHHLRGRSGNTMLPNSSVPRWLLPTSAAALCLMGCSSLALVGFKFGMIAYTGVTLGLMFVTLLLYASLAKLGFQRLSEVVWNALFSTYIAAFNALIVAFILNSILRGRDDGWSSYAGSPLSIFSAVLCVAQGIYFCYGCFRWNWLRDSWLAP